LLPLSVNKVGGDKPPIDTVFDVAESGIHPELIVRIPGFRVIQQTRIRHTVAELSGFRQSGFVVSFKIVFREIFAAFRALKLPRFVFRVDNPIVHDDFVFAGGANPAGLHHPRPFQLRVKHKAPKLVIA
jgi:hypothetical protein